MQQGRYTECEGGRHALAKWRSESDSVALFAQEQTQPATAVEPGWRAAGIYSTYREWALENGYRPVSSKEFAKRMGSAGKAVVHRADGNWYPVMPRPRFIG